MIALTRTRTHEGDSQFSLIIDRSTNSQGQYNTRFNYTLYTQAIDLTDTLQFTYCACFEEIT